MQEIANEAGAAVEQYVKESGLRAKRVANDPAVLASALAFFEVIRRSWLRNGSPAVGSVN